MDTTIESESELENFLIRKRIETIQYEYYELFDLLKELEEIYCHGTLIFSKDNKKQCIVFNDEETERMNSLFNKWITIYVKKKGWNV